ncbi:MAG: VWA domain-containing protein [Deltaproteobacteria bacterium]|nr:VWA domain-containing protein [Deltaproteobacteria bacterium]
MSYRFAYLPVLLLLLPVAGFLVWRLLSRPSSVAFPSAARLKPLADRMSALRARLPLFLRTAVLVFLVLSAARPQTYTLTREVSDSGVDIMLCIDTSGSMRGMDFNIDGQPVERLTAVKKVLHDFVKKRAHDRMGLVVFGSQAYTQAPLTLDKGLLLSLVDRLSVGMAGDTTAIGDALALSGKRMKAVSAPTKIIILLTDGRQNAGTLEARDAASALAALGMKIYTIGVGTYGRVPFRVPGLFGDRMIYQNVDFDDKLLKEIAVIGNGRYFYAGDTETLESIYKEIDKAEKSEVKVKEYSHYRELFPIFLIPALILALLEILAVSRRALP